MSESTPKRKDNMKNMSIPKIKINDNTYIYSAKDNEKYQSESDLSNFMITDDRGRALSSRRGPTNKLAVESSALGSVRSCQVQTKIVDISILPSKQSQKPSRGGRGQPMPRQKDIEAMNKKVNDIKEEISKNKEQSKSLEGKVSEIYSSLDLITSMVKEIAK